MTGTGGDQGGSALRMMRGATAAAELLRQTDSHISAGRMPWLKLETKEMILRRSGAVISAAPG